MKIEGLGLEANITIKAKTLQIFEFVQSNYNNEFTAFCHSEKDGNEYMITDIFFPKQENTQTTTECNSDDLIELMSEGFDITMGNGHIHKM